jgi:uncharacterized membrane protein
MFIAGFVFVLPMFFVFQIANRVWTSLGSLAIRIARLGGEKHSLGVQAETVVTGILLVVICLACGWLVHFSLVSAFHNFIERTLARYIPGYETYRATTESKVHKPVKVLPYTSALIKHAGFWQPGYVIERDDAGNAVIFLPDIPNTDHGQVLLATASQVQVIPSVTANQLDAALKQRGKGLLNELPIRASLIVD